MGSVRVEVTGIISGEYMTYTGADKALTIKA